MVAPLDASSTFGAGDFDFLWFCQFLNRVACNGF
jgi:hypothetical protein